MNWTAVKDVNPKLRVPVVVAWKTGSDHFEYCVLMWNGEEWYDEFGNTADAPDYWTRIFKPVT